MKEIIKKYLYNYYFLCIASAFVINFLIEIFSRHSIVAAFNYLIHSPVVFTYNVLLILLTFSLILLVRRKFFVFTTISLIWLAGGIYQRNRFKQSCHSIYGKRIKINFINL